MAITLYNHACDVGFVTISREQDFSKVTVDELIEGLEARIVYLKSNRDEALEAIGLSDTYEEVYNPERPLDKQFLSWFAQEHIKRRTLAGNGL